MRWNLTKKSYLKWHKYPDDDPESYSGSFLILTDTGEIAEAEYRGNTGWFQYRWSTPIESDHVIAWCAFASIKENVNIDDN